MDYKKRNVNLNKTPSIPEEPEQTWWKSVLQDEPPVKDPTEVIDSETSTDDFIGCIESGRSTKNDWAKVLQLFEDDEVIVLEVVDLNKGGVLVEGEGICGFVPVSHLVNLTKVTNKIEREKYLHNYLGCKISLKIIECEPKKDRIIFSERAAQAGTGQRKKLLHNLYAGDVVEGHVTNITSFGVFVDLGGLEGLIHLSELSWGRVQHPSSILKVGDNIDVMIIEIYKDQCRIALSLKRLHKNPWKDLSETLKPGDIVDAEVSSIVSYGAFAELEAGIEGLIHISAMNIPQEYHRIDEYLYEGQAIKVKVINLDTQEKRLGLSFEGFR